MTTTNTPEPVATLVCGGLWNNKEIEDWEIEANAKVCERINQNANGSASRINLYPESALQAERERAEKEGRLREETADKLVAVLRRAEKAEAELAALKEALRNPPDEVIDAPRSFLLGMDAGCMTSAKMRDHLRLSGVDFSMLPEWFQTGDAHLTKAGRAICILAFMRAHLLKD